MMMMMMIDNDHDHLIINFWPIQRPSKVSLKCQNDLDTTICNLFDIYMFILVEDSTHTVTSLLFWFSRGPQITALITIVMTIAGSIFNSWLRCYRIV